MSDLPFTCACGRVYEETSWKKLHVVGHTCFSEDLEGPEQHIEMRNCPCGTTKAVEVSPEHEDCALNKKGASQ